ncbi:MAG: S8 family serine peptidase [Fervidicoccaceae archaeon]
MCFRSALSKHGPLVDRASRTPLLAAALLVAISSSLAVVAISARAETPGNLVIVLPSGASARLIVPPGVSLLAIEQTFSSTSLRGPLKATLDYKPALLRPLSLAVSSAPELPGPTMEDLLSEIGATWPTPRGEGIVVGFIDTGLDLAAGCVGLSDVARDVVGRPLLFDADSFGLALTPLSVSYRDPEQRFLATGGSLVLVYLPGYGKARVLVDADWGAPPIKSSSGLYKFGFLVSFFFPSNVLLDASLPGLALLVPVVLVDTKEPGIYDEVFADLSTSWYVLGSFYYGLGLSREPPRAELADLSFADEKGLRIGDGVAVFDANGDGVPDFSLGAISGYVYDAFGVVSSEGVDLERAWERAWEPRGSGIYPGLDPSGRYVDFFYDPIGHGTSVVCAAVGRPLEKLAPSPAGQLVIVSRGVAPSAKVAAAQALMLGNVGSALKWMGGYEFVDGEWVPASRPRVDIVSNSWGIPFWPELLFADGGGFAPGLDPLSEIVAEVASRGVIPVFAAGNGGPGLSTVAVGGASGRAVTVGAYALAWEPLRDARGHLLLPGCVGSNVVSWSSRGPGLADSFKPDAVAPGAYVLLPTSVNNGMGDGRRALDFFGGTSLSAAVTAGVLALALEKARSLGLSYDALGVEWAREILRSSSRDLGLPPEIQGAGLLNLSRLLELIAFSGAEAASEDVALVDEMGEVALRSRGLAEPRLEAYVAVSRVAPIAVELKDFELKRVSLPRLGPNEVLYVDLSFENETRRGSSVVALLGVQRREGLEGFILIDHGLLAEQGLRLVASTSSIERLTPDEVLELLLVPLGPADGVRLWVEATKLAKIELRPRSGEGLIYRFNVSLLSPPGRAAVYINESGAKRPLVLDRPLTLKTEDFVANLSTPSPISSSLSAAGELGDFFYFGLRGPPSEEGSAVLGYVVEPSPSLELYVIERGPHGLGLVRLTSASLPLNLLVKDRLEARSPGLLFLPARGVDDLTLVVHTARGLRDSITLVVRPIHVEVRGSILSCFFELRLRTSAYLGLLLVEPWSVIARVEPGLTRVSSCYGSPPTSIVFLELKPKALAGLLSEVDARVEVVFEPARVEVEVPRSALIATLFNTSREKAISS